MIKNTTHPLFMLLLGGGGVIVNTNVKKIRSKTINLFKILIFIS